MNGLRTYSRRVTYALLLFGIIANIVAWEKSANAQNSEANYTSLLNQITALKSKPGSDEWDGEVAPILIAAFDTDKSGIIDTRAEVSAIPCGLLLALDGITQPYDNGRTGLVWTYGFQPDTKGKTYKWVGNQLGFHKNMRSAGYQQMKRCGLRTRD